MEVERRLLDGASVKRVMAELAEEWDCHPWTIYRDCRAVLAEWRRQDSRESEARRSRTVRALEETIAQARARGQFTAAVRGFALLSRILGLTGAGDVVIQNSFTVNNGPATIADLARLAARQKQQPEVITTLAPRDVRELVPEPPGVGSDGA